MKAQSRFLVRADSTVDHGCMEERDRETACNATRSSFLFWVASLRIRHRSWQKKLAMSFHLVMTSSSRHDFSSIARDFTPYIMGYVSQWCSAIWKATHRNRHSQQARSAFDGVVGRIGCNMCQWAETASCSGLSRWPQKEAFYALRQTAVLLPKSHLICSVSFPN